VSLLGGGTRAAVGRSGPCSSIDAAMPRGNGGRSKAPKAKACMRNAAVATAKMNSAMITGSVPALARSSPQRAVGGGGAKKDQQENSQKE